MPSLFGVADSGAMFGHNRCKIFVIGFDRFGRASRSSFSSIVQWVPASE